MKQIFNFIFYGFCTFAISACTAEEEELTSNNNSQEKMTVSFRVRAHGTSDQINKDNTHKEDFVDNIVLAGSSLATYDGAVATFNINSFIGKKNFFFVANLKQEDQTRIGAAGTESDFNALHLNTADYLRGYASNPPDKSIVMAATLRDVTVQGAVLSQEQVKLKRLFAKVNYDFTTGVFAGLTIQKITLENIPAKFAIGGPIDNYDLKNKKEAANYPYLTYQLSNNKGTVYLPEHFVSNPAFRSPDAHGMTHFVITHLKRGVVETLKLRIGVSTPYSTSYGQIQRNKEITPIVTEDLNNNIWLN